eukprot:2298395-Amphidinium_carterae.1
MSAWTWAGFLKPFGKGCSAWEFSMLNAGNWVSMPVLRGGRTLRHPSCKKMKRMSWWIREMLVQARQAQTSKQGAELSVVHARAVKAYAKRRSEA